MQPWQWNSLLPNFRPAKKQVVNLKHHHTLSAISKPTILYSSLICKEHCGYHLKMLTADTESINYQFTYPNSTRCLDPYHTNCSSSEHQDTNMSWGSHGDHHNTKTSTHTKLPMACSATSPNFYLPPRYETPTLDVNVSLHMANLHMLNILAQDFCIWKHLGSNRSDMQLQHLTIIPSIPEHKIYQHLLNNTLPIIPFDIESTEHIGLIWTLFSHPRIYVLAIGLLIPVGLGLFCCYFFWCGPARLAHQPLQSGNMWYTIVDDNVEVVSIYRCNGKESQPTRPH